MMYYVNPQSNAGVYREGKWKLVWKQTNKYSNGNYTEPAEGTCGYNGLVEEGNYSLDQIDELNANLQSKVRNKTSSHLSTNPFN